MVCVFFNMLPALLVFGIACVTGVLVAVRRRPRGVVHPVSNDSSSSDGKDPYHDDKPHPAVEAEDDGVDDPPSYLEACDQPRFRV